jgi:quinolinate synthase
MNAGQRAIRREEVIKGIRAVKEHFGKELLILAHFYEDDAIVECADFVGDSLQLAEKAALNRDARFIIFCAVSFMAETARILCSPEQVVVHPEPDARCPLADMADIHQVETAWNDLESLGKKIIPVVYVNSNADLKAFCARKGGTVCTSSNAKKIFGYVLSRDASLFFFPDENMGRNISHDLGIGDDEMFLWDPREGSGERDRERAGRAKVFLWAGFCIVHQVMGLGDIEELRRKYKDIGVIVHPECIPGVYNGADSAGSTSFIKKTIDGSAPGSKWAVGTEWNFVNRLRNGNPDKFIIPLREERCREMAKVTPEKLLQVLEALREGKPLEGVTVAEGLREDAKQALLTMFEVG